MGLRNDKARDVLQFLVEHAPCDLWERALDSNLTDAQLLGELVDSGASSQLHSALAPNTGGLLELDDSQAEIVRLMLREYRERLAPATSNVDSV